MLNVRQFTVRYWEEPEGGYGGQCIELPGAVSQGETLEELSQAGALHASFREYELAEFLTRFLVTT